MFFVVNKRIFLKFKWVKFSKKTMESEFSGSMRVHVYTICPKCIQSFINSIKDYKCKELRRPIQSLRR